MKHFLRRWLWVYREPEQAWIRLDRIGAVREYGDDLQVQDMGGHWWTVLEEDDRTTNERDLMRLVSESLARRSPGPRESHAERSAHEDHRVPPPAHV